MDIPERGTDSRSSDETPAEAKKSMLNNRQTQLLEAMKAAGCVSPVSRQDIVDACAVSGAYACPPSWLTQDSARKVGRGLYDCPELAEMGDSAPAPVAPAPAPAVESTPAQSALRFFHANRPSLLRVPSVPVAPPERTVAPEASNKFQETSDAQDPPPHSIMPFSLKVQVQYLSLIHI